ncbi:MAG: prolyl hydroxylase family protein [Rickettsiales bacterium]
MAVLNDAWKAWLKESLDMGCDPVELRDILAKNHFPAAEIERQMGDKFPREGIVILPPEDYLALSKVNITRIGTRYATDAMQLYTLDNFMTQEECAQITAISYQRLRPSVVIRPDYPPGFRTSSSCDLMQLDDPLVATINNRIAATLGVNVTYADDTEAQVYEVGQEVKPHCDYFEPYSDDYKLGASTAGNRTWTFMVYLNEPLKGGATWFTELDITLTPKLGQAVVWNNLLPNGKTNPRTIHCGMPVEEGSKVIITKWFRELGHGPLFLN